MPIIQPDPRETQLPSSVVLASTDSAEPLELPHPKPRPDRKITGILWALLLAFGILMLLVRTPLHAPPFESLTEYTCDRLPLLPALGNRSQSYQLNIRCRSGDKVVFQRSLPAYTSNPAWVACRRSGGLIRIWRVANPSPYGPYVFHATCDEHVITYYPIRVTTYESTQAFVIVVASLILLVGAIGLSANLTKALFRRRQS